MDSVARLVLKSGHAVHFPTRQGRQHMKFSEDPDRARRDRTAGGRADRRRGRHRQSSRRRRPAAVLTNVNVERIERVRSLRHRHRAHAVLPDQFERQSHSLNNDTELAVPLQPEVSTDYPNGNYTAARTLRQQAGNLRRSRRAASRSRTAAPRRTWTPSRRSASPPAEQRHDQRADHLPRERQR